MNTVYLIWHLDNWDDNWSSVREPINFTYKLSRAELDIIGLAFEGQEGDQRAQQLHNQHNISLLCT